MKTGEIMKKIRRRVILFLRGYEMDVLDIHFDENVDRLLEQMRKGLTGRASSLEMIPTYIDVEAEVPSGRPVIVADAGGTNFRVATVVFDDKKRPIIENLRLFAMPGVEKEVSCEEFFAIMADYFRDVAAAASEIGFCFSYPTQMFPSKDGRLIRFSKEIKAPGVIGQFIGKGLNKALAAANLGGDRHIVILNDTVATLLAGRGYKNRTFSSYIGFILGTGTNCAYIEKNAAIAGNKDLDPDKSQIINTESGGFARCHRGKIDVAFDKSTINPGMQKFEKMISGAYLGPLILWTIRRAAKDGLFTPSAAAALLAVPDLSTKQVSEYMDHPYGANPLARAVREGGANDPQTLYFLADRLTERAAKLSAVNLAAMAVRTGQGTDPTCPICMVAEGTTFFKLKNLKSRVEFYLKQNLEDKRQIYAEIVSVDNATLVGAAIAGLTN
jgi:hexokinase